MANEMAGGAPSCPVAHDRSLVFAVLHKSKPKKSGLTPLAAQLPGPRLFYHLCLQRTRSLVVKGTAALSSPFISRCSEYFSSTRCSTTCCVDAPGLLSAFSYSSCPHSATPTWLGNRLKLALGALPTQMSPRPQDHGCATTTAIFPTQEPQ